MKEKNQNTKKGTRDFGGGGRETYYLPACNCRLQQKFIFGLERRSGNYEEEVSIQRKITTLKKFNFGKATRGVLPHSG